MFRLFTWVRQQFKIRFESTSLVIIAIIVTTRLTRSLAEQNIRRSFADLDDRFPIASPAKRYDLIISNWTFNYSIIRLDNAKLLSINHCFSALVLRSSQSSDHSLDSIRHSRQTDEEVEPIGDSYSLNDADDIGHTLSGSIRPGILRTAYVVSSSIYSLYIDSIYRLYTSVVVVKGTVEVCTIDSSTVPFTTTTDV